MGRHTSGAAPQQVLDAGSCHHINHQQRRWLRLWLDGLQEVHMEHTVTRCEDPHCPCQTEARRGMHEASGASSRGADSTLLLSK